ncbi:MULTISPECIES: hypothetical protein [unclassified Streptomyces]|uniref:hypothetical protein n=1 Tax=unclassified Streptomyces TaxID=2593676 RepID=UPI00338F5371
MLVEAPARTGQVGVCQVALRSRERIALLRPRHGMLILQTLVLVGTNCAIRGTSPRPRRSPTGSWSSPRC